MLLARPTAASGQECRWRTHPKRCCQATRPRFRGWPCPATTRPLGDEINRDPIGEWGGVNIYLFVGNDPVATTDVAGLQRGATPWRPPLRPGVIEPEPFETRPNTIPELCNPSDADQARWRALEAWARMMHPKPPTDNCQQRYRPKGPCNYSLVGHYLPDGTFYGATIYFPARPPQTPPIGPSYPSLPQPFPINRNAPPSKIILPL